MLLHLDLLNGRRSKIFSVGGFEAKNARGSIEQNLPQPFVMVLSGRSAAPLLGS